MSDPDEPVTCARHGQGVATFVCQHLRDGVACGYHSADEDENDRWPDAWCDQCEAVIQQQGGWNEISEAQADISLLCNTCYDEAKARNARVPSPLVPGALDLSDDQIDLLISHACVCIQERNTKAGAGFGFNTHQRWSADYEAGRFMLGSASNTSIVADMEVAGSFSKKANSWLWAWANASMEPILTRDVSRLRALGLVRGIKLLSDEHQENVDVEHCWHLASLAGYILGFDAVYRAPMDQRYLFMLLRNLRRTS